MRMQILEATRSSCSFGRYREKVGLLCDTTAVLRQLILIECVARSLKGEQVAGGGGCVVVDSENFCCMCVLEFFALSFDSSESSESFNQIGIIYQEIGHNCIPEK